MKRSALLVGSFVLGAIVLAVVTILWMSGNSLFERQLRAVLYFRGGVAGLYVGAPVSFRGVPVGQVESIDVEIDDASLQARIPVRIRLSPSAVRVSGKKADSVDQLELESAVKRGLRAKLVAQSFVTGQKSIDLDFVRPAPPLPAGMASNPSVPEIPIVADRFDALVDQVAQVPLRDMVEDVRTTLQALRNTLTATEATFSGAGQELTATAAQARQTLQAATAAMVAATRTVERVQDSATASLGAVTRLADSTRDVVGQAQPELQRTLATAREAAEQARLAMSRVAELAAPQAPVRQDLEASMRDLSQAARSLRDWAELLESQPNAVIFGNRQP